MTDKEMIENPLNWPRYPFLPVKRYRKPGELADCRVIWVGARTRLVEANLFALPKTKEDFLALPYTEYANIEAVLADGWVVD